MHIQGCEAADAHYDSYENKQAAYCAVESLRTHPENCYEAEKPGKKLKFGGMIAARTLCPISHGVTQCCVRKAEAVAKKLRELALNFIMAMTSSMTSKTSPTELQHLADKY